MSSTRIVLLTAVGIEVVVQPQLSLFAFQVTWPGSTTQQRNDATIQLLKDVAKLGRVFMSGCWIDENYYGRVCVLGFRTRRDTVDMCIEDVRQVAAQIVDRMSN